jgi:flagellar biosynthesis/type III secretory pathway protein FliH
VYEEKGREKLKRRTERRGVVKGWGTAQVVDSLPSMCEDLSSTPSTSKNERKEREREKEEEEGRKEGKKEGRKEGRKERRMDIGHVWYSNQDGVVLVKEKLNISRR